MMEETIPFNNMEMEQVKFKSLTECLEEKLKPQHTEIDLPPSKNILDEIDTFDLNKEREKIISFIDELYPNGKIPKYISKLVIHLSEDDNDYYEMWMSVLGKAIDDKILSDYCFTKILQEWYYTIQIFNKSPKTNKILYYSGWILNILLLFRKSPIYYSHKIHDMVEHYSNLIAILIHSHHGVIELMSPENLEKIKPKSDIKEDLDFNLLINYMLIYLLPIYNYQYSDIIDNFHIKLKWGLPKNKISQEIKAELPKLYTYLLNSKYGKNYSLWLTSCELIVGTSNVLINSKLFHYCVIICKLNSLNPYFLEEYYKLINSRLFLIEFDKYHKLFDINSYHFTELFNRISSMVYFMVVFIKSIMKKEFVINMEKVKLSKTIINKITNTNIDILSFCYIINYEVLGELYKNDEIHNIVSPKIKMEFINTPEWFKKQILKYELTDEELEEVQKKFSNNLFIFYRHFYYFLSPCVNYTKIDHNYGELVHIVSSIIKSLY